MRSDQRAATMSRKLIPNVLYLPALGLFATPAGAASPVFVDPGGGRNGSTPCFTTIQAGVNNAPDPDAALGGAFAEVFVFPGTYAESVNLSLMGSAVAGAPGDLRLVTADASGTPTPGTATVNPAAGPAFRNSVGPFPGNLALDGFVVLSPDSHGVSLGVVNGTVALSNLTASGNAETGVDLAAVGDVNISNTTANGNSGGDGF